MESFAITDIGLALGALCLFGAFMYAWGYRDGQHAAEDDWRAMLGTLDDDLATELQQRTQQIRELKPDVLA